MEYMLSHFGELGRQRLGAIEVPWPPPIWVLMLRSWYLTPPGVFADPWVHFTTHVCQAQVESKPVPLVMALLGP